MLTDKGKLAWDLFSELRKELVESQRIRTQIIGFKITLVSAAVGVIATKPVSPSLLVLPSFAAIFFDLLIHGCAFSIKRIGYYCREHLEPMLQEEFALPKKFPLWQKFLLEKIAHQPLTFWGNFGLTALTCVAGAFADLNSPRESWSVAVVWMLGALLLLDLAAYWPLRRFHPRTS